MTKTGKGKYVVDTDLIPLISTTKKLEIKSALVTRVRERERVFAWQPLTSDWVWVGVCARLFWRQNFGAAFEDSVAAVVVLLFHRLPPHFLWSHPLAMLYNGKPHFY